MAVNINKVLRRFKSTEDKIADKITATSGTIIFVYIHMAWFGLWILLNAGVFGIKYEFDTFPFGLLTLIVSLEAIFLSTFVMITQNREAQENKLRNEINFIAQQQEEKEVRLVMLTLERIAKKQGVDVTDLVEELEEAKADTHIEVEKIRQDLKK
jgi:uncharacterized membrane protein